MNALVEESKLIDCADDVSRFLICFDQLGEHAQDELLAGLIEAAPASQEGRFVLVFGLFERLWARRKEGVKTDII